MKAVIRKTNKEDKNKIIELFESLSEKEKKFLALKSKLSLIKKEISSGRHCYVLEVNKNILAFARESGRPNGFVMLEEIVVAPIARGKGIASKLVGQLLSEFPKIETKIFAENEPMKNLLKKFGFKIIKKSPNGKIIYLEKRPRVWS